MLVVMQQTRIFRRCPGDEMRQNNARVTQSELETHWLQRGTSLMRKHFPLGPYSRPMPGALCWFTGGWVFLMSEVPLFMHTTCRVSVASFQVLLKL